MGKVYDAPSVQGDVDTIDYYSDGSAIEKVVDRAHTQPWESHTLAIDQAFHETTDQYGYGSALPAFFNTHDIAALQFASWDESTAGTFVASIERAMYSGAAVAGGIEDIFAGLGPHRQFTTGAYDVDVETGTLDTDPAEFGTGLTLVNPSSAFDNSSYDNAWQLWDYQTAAQGAFEVSTFDGWGYGTWYEPVILDLDGNGVSITPRDGSLAEFDVDGDGYDEHAAWVGAGDGLLVLNDTANDLPSGVVIANRNEIAFSQTPGVTDLEALAAYDTNHDGAIDAGDARWSDFRVWIDKNGDGYSAVGELKMRRRLECGRGTPRLSM